MPRPYTARECADYLGFTTEWVRRAITEGVLVGGQLVKLEAEQIVVHNRMHYRVHEGHFITFLRAIGWKRLPRRSETTPAPLGPMLPLVTESLA